MKELKRIPIEQKSRIHSAILKLSEQPRKHGVRKLIQREDIYRFRVGNYRILFQIDDKELLISVLEIKHRKEVYR